MTMSKNLKKHWRVEVRVFRGGVWRRHSGLFETRRDARARAVLLRDHHLIGGGVLHRGYGFGNTRVVPYVKGQK
jgi:hypothetical protein